MNIQHSILLPAVVLATWTSIWHWGRSLIGFLLTLIFGIPMRKDAQWASNRTIALDSLKDGVWLNPYRDGLLNVSVTFYVLSMAFAITGRVDSLYFILAWGYVILGIVFSLSSALAIGAINRQFLFFVSIAFLQILSVRFILVEFVC
ncbi:hypothetical protein [Paraburkholderia solisilvae]|uniref:hypothetical protein n=1 Tax=Paraburkholderia solisilvae TaxID=624376 RepID=UPI0036425410